MTARGDVVIVQFPYQDGTRGKNLFTVSQADILRTIGRLSPALMATVDACLKASLGLK